MALPGRASSTPPRKLPVMTATEFTKHNHTDVAAGPVLEAQDTVGLSGEGIEVLVDEEWCITGGDNEMAALLGLDRKSIMGTPIGRFMHPEDVVISPARIWRSGRSRVIKFRECDGYVRLAVRIRRTSNGWQLELTGLEAEILQFLRVGGTVG